MSTIGMNRLGINWRSSLPHTKAERLMLEVSWARGSHSSNPFLCRSLFQWPPLWPTCLLVGLCTSQRSDEHQPRVGPPMRVGLHTLSGMRTSYALGIFPLRLPCSSTIKCCHLPPPSTFIFASLSIFYPLYVISTLPFWVFRVVWPPSLLSRHLY